MFFISVFREMFGLFRYIKLLHNSQSNRNREKQLKYFLSYLSNGIAWNLNLSVNFGHFFMT